MALDLSIPNPISSIVQGITTILQRVLPDKAQQDAAKSELAQMALSGELQQMHDQLTVDLAEAQKTPFTWREGVGWVCVIGLFSQFLVQPFFTWACALAHRNVVYPTLDTATLYGIVASMLGIGTHELMTSDKYTTNGKGNVK
jgi:hypothetical protein